MIRLDNRTEYIANTLAKFCEAVGYNEVVKRLKWMVAIEEENDMIHNNQTWELINRPLRQS